MDVYIVRKSPRLYLTKAGNWTDRKAWAGAWPEEAAKSMCENLNKTLLKLKSPDTATTEPI